MNELFRKLDTPLPVFAVDNGEFTSLYTPGSSLTIKAIPFNELNRLFNKPDEIKDPFNRNAITTILKLGQEAVNKWEHQKQLPFIPECLTIHVGSDCNLKCTYCYSKAFGQGNKTLLGFPDKKAIVTLFSDIAERRIKNSERFTVVFHGSGEPTFHWQRLVDSFNDISVIAKQHDLKIFTYIATNGILTDVQIDWLAENMDGIGISCDGPPSIQKKQRLTNSRFYPPVEEVCKRILKKGGKVENRVTITPDTISHLKEITEYLIEKCKAKTIRVEPVFLAGPDGFKEEDAEYFYDRFVETRNYAEKNGVSFTYAGIRMSELHGPYCDVLRNNLRLNSDNVTRNCFCFMSDQSEFITGQYNDELSSFHLSSDIESLNQISSGIPDECNQCINVFHCSRGCPDYCIFDNSNLARQLNPFRCKLHKLLAVSEIKNSSFKQMISHNVQ
jgi:radical SAM protein with 4Fe4S-binding SPASM domain